MDVSAHRARTFTFGEYDDLSAHLWAFLDPDFEVSTRCTGLERLKLLSIPRKLGVPIQLPGTSTDSAALYRVQRFWSTFTAEHLKRDDLRSLNRPVGGFILVVPFILFIETNPFPLILNTPLETMV